MNIAAIISDELRQRGMTQMDMAREIGVTQSYVSQICSGKKIPRLGTLVKISRCLDIPVEKLVEEKNADKAEQDGGKTPVLNKKEARILRLYRKMNWQDQKIITQLMNRMAGGGGNEPIRPEEWAAQADEIETD